MATVVQIIGDSVGRKKVQDLLALATTVLEESIGGVRVVKAFQRQAYESRRYAGRIEETFDLSMAVARLNALFRPLITFLFSCTVVLIFWYGGKEVLAGRLSTGRLMSFVILTLTLAASVSECLVRGGDGDAQEERQGRNHPHYYA